MWVQTPAIAPGLVAFRINDLLGAPLRGLQPNEWLVNVETSSALLKGYTSRPATNPTTGRAFAVVSGGDRSELEGRGLQTWDPVEFIILLVSAEIRRQAERLFDVEDAEYQLARLETAFPALVHLALERFSVGTITRVLRGLLADQNSVRNLRLILERMLQFEAIRADSDKLIVFDDRFTVPMEQPVGSSPGWSEMLEFVQSGLKFYLAHKLTRGQNSLPVLLLAPAVEERLGGSWPALDPTAPAPFTATEEQALLDQIWQNVAGLNGSYPSILLTPRARYPMRQLLRAELPELSVVAYTQLSPNVSIQPLARISLE
jgi:type III secretion protein V